MTNYYNLIIEHANTNSYSAITVMGTPMYIVQAVSQFGATPTEVRTDSYSQRVPSHGGVGTFDFVFEGIIKFKDKHGTELVITGSVSSDVFKHIYDEILINQF